MGVTGEPAARAACSPSTPATARPTSALVAADGRCSARRAGGLPAARRRRRPRPSPVLRRWWPRPPLRPARRSRRRLEPLRRHVSACLANADLPVEERQLAAAVRRRRAGALGATSATTRSRLLRAGVRRAARRRRRLRRGHQLLGRAARRPHRAVRRRRPHLRRLGRRRHLAEEAMWWAARAEDGRGARHRAAARSARALRLDSMGALIEACTSESSQPEQCGRAHPGALRRRRRGRPGRRIGRAPPGRGDRRARRRSALRRLGLLGRVGRRASWAAAS